MSDVALEVTGLNAGYGSGHSRTRVVHDASLTVRPGEIVGVIGETGSGKTTLARAIAGFVPAESGRVEVGTASGPVEIAGLRGRALRRFRRTGQVHYVFQDPLRCLDPDLTVGRSIAEGLTLAGSTQGIAARVAEVLRAVGLPEGVADRYPGQISGGQRQRVSIARAIAGNPRVLILDEPVSALDASNRNHILRLIDGLRDRDPRPGLLLISHDLSSLAGIADRVVVMYRGRIVEEGPIQQVFEHPRHPYTALLIASAPSVRREHRILPAQLRRAPSEPWVAAGQGDGESPAAEPIWTAQACGFSARCRFATAACTSTPELVTSPADAGRAVACHHADTWRQDLSNVQPLTELQSV